ncbi:unnamed protein product, partial [Urochloa humidicola]
MPIPFRIPSSSKRKATSATAPTPPPPASASRSPSGRPARRGAPASPSTAPDLDPSDFGAAPMILSTESDLVLLLVPICHSSCVLNPWRNHYFVYQAGGGAGSKRAPSLYLIPTPPPLYFSDYQIGLLRCR